MGKKLPITPVSQIKGCFRMLSLRAREVQAARKRDGNTCTVCHRHNTVAKGKEVQVQIHHTRKPNWDLIVSVIRQELLNPNYMVCLCKECHDAEHDKDGSGWEGQIKRKENKQ